MAKFYGSGGGYLLRSDLKYYSYALLLAALPLLLVWLMWEFLSPGWVLAGAIFLVLFAAKISEPLIDSFKRKSNKFFRGRGGEADVRLELQNLPDDCSVFQNLVLGENKGDLDFVVAAPSGIYLLEVKSHGGEIGFNGIELTLNGQGFKEKDFLRQIHGQTYALKNYLLRQTGKELYIRSALVFSSSYAGMRFGYNPVGHTYIIQKDFLAGLFGRFPAYAYPVPREAVEAALLKLQK